MKTKTPEPDPGTPEPQPRPDEDAAERRRQEALRDLLNARPGPVDQDPTDPDGTADEYLGDGAGVITDPALAGWHAKVRSKYNAAFNPLGKIPQGKRILARVWFVPDSGAVTKTKILEASGVLAIDRAAKTALETVTRIDPPPADKRADAAQQSVDIEFTTE